LGVSFFLAPIADSKFKRGGAIQVRWTGGNPDDEYALDLFDGRFHYRHVGELKNSGTDPWIIPKDVKPEDLILMGDCVKKHSEKGIFIEGTSIIGREKQQELKYNGFDLEFSDESLLIAKGFPNRDDISPPKFLLIVSSELKMVLKIQ